jgi:hypothetical protein
MVQTGRENPPENRRSLGPVGARKMPVGGMGVNLEIRVICAAFAMPRHLTRCFGQAYRFIRFRRQKMASVRAIGSGPMRGREKRTMTRLDQARAKLSAAMDRLEAVASKSGGAATGTSKRIAELEAELAKLRRDHAALEATVDLVAVRLDAAIGRLKTTVAA